MVRLHGAEDGRLGPKARHARAERRVSGASQGSDQLPLVPRAPLAVIGQAFAGRLAEPWILELVDLREGGHLLLRERRLGLQQLPLFRSRSDTSRYVGDMGSPFSSSGLAPGQTPGIHDRIKASTDIDPDTRRAYASRLRGYLGVKPR
jgi:hypothetical protein